MVASVTELIQRVKSRISLPDNDDRFTPNEIVDVMNDVMEEFVIPELMKYMEEYLVVKQVVKLRTGGQENFPDYLIPLPTRAYGLTLRNVKYRRAGDTEDYQNINIPYIAPEDEEFRQGDRDLNFRGHSLGFYFQGPAIKLIGNPTSLDGELILSFVIKPSKLVNRTSDFAPISNITVQSTFLRASSTSIGAEFDSWLSAPSTRLVDILHVPSGHILAFNQRATRSGSNYDLIDLKSSELKNFSKYQSGGLPLNTAQGFSSEVYLIRAGESQFSQLPKEYDNLLIYATCGRILEALGDTDGLQVNSMQMDKVIQSIKSAYGKRSQGEGKKITNRRGLHTMIQSRGWRGRWRS
jgi:hypothetical protein